VSDLYNSIHADQTIQGPQGKPNNLPPKTETHIEADNVKQAGPQKDQSGQLRRWLGRLLPLLISAFFLWLVFRRVEWSRLQQAFSEISYPLLPAVILVYLAGFIPRAQKWRLILHKLKPVSLGACLGYSFVGCAGNAVLPARLGEVVRAYICGRREEVAATSVLSTIVLERVLEVVSLMLLFGFTVWATGQGALKSWALVGLAVICAVVTLIFIMQRRGDWLLKLVGLIPWEGPRHSVANLAKLFLEGLAVVRDPKGLLLVLALGLLVYCIEGGAYWLLAKAMGLEVSYLQSLFVLCFIFVGMLIPATVGNIGPLQYFCVLGFGFFGVHEEPALIYSVFLNAILYIPALVGFMYLARYGFTLGGLRDQASQATQMEQEKDS
jgi:uncharacterized protein (TIRG00374 family)